MESIVTYTSYDKRFVSENPSDVKKYELGIINKHKVYTSQDSSFSVFKVDDKPFFECLIENLASHCTETISPPCYVVWEPYANNNSGTFTSLETYKKSGAWRDKLLADFEFAQPERLLDHLEEIVTKVEAIIVKYEKPYPHRWAIVEYEGLGYYVGEYFIYGKELITGDVLTCWAELPYMARNPAIIQEGFATKEEALAALPKYETAGLLRAKKRIEP